MPTYDEVLFLGIEYGLIAVLPIVLIVIVILLNRHHERFHVWADITLKSGHIRRKKYRPQQGMIITKKWGSYKVSSESIAGMFKGRPLFRFFEDYPYGIVYTHDKIPIMGVKTIKGEDGKEKKIEGVVDYQTVVKPMPVAPSSSLISAMLKDRSIEQAYGRNTTIEFLLIAIAVLVVIGLIATIAK